MPKHDESCCPKWQHGFEFEAPEVRQLRRIANELVEMNNHLACICKALQPPPIEATDFNLNSIQGDIIMAISPVTAGSSSQYLLSLVPANAIALQSGPTATSDNPLVVLTQDATNPFLITAAADATVTGASFNLTANGVNGAGTAITHTFAIPISQAPPPQAVDFDLNDAPVVTPLAKK